MVGYTVTVVDLPDVDTVVGDTVTVVDLFDVDTVVCDTITVVDLPDVDTVVGDTVTVVDLPDVDTVVGDTVTVVDLPDVDTVVGDSVTVVLLDVSFPGLVVDTTSVATVTGSPVLARYSLEGVVPASVKNDRNAILRTKYEFIIINRYMCNYGLRELLSWETSKPSFSRS